MPAEAVTLTFEQWQEEKLKTLPHKCPKCSGSLEEVRFRKYEDSTAIALTGAGWKRYRFAALCPSCDKILAQYRTGIEAPR